MAEEPTATEEESTASPEEEHGAGPGFFLGLVLGALTGAAAAALLAPSTGEELRHRVTEEAGPILAGEGAAEGAEAGAPVERIRGALDRVRARVREASEEARAAAHEAEEQKRARYSELTQQEESPS